MTSAPSTPPAPPFLRLRVWRSAIDLAAEIYRITTDFPTRERYALAIQMRRASVSVMSNIAEGKGRRSAREFSHFLDVANGSLRELQSQILLASRLGMIIEPDARRLLESSALTSSALTQLIRHLRSRATQGSTRGPA
ncbi:MAG: four helix bundle protein [Gemmatimonadota bacterium]